MSTPLIAVRTAPREATERLIAGNVPPLLAQLYAARGIASTDALDCSLSRLLSPQSMRNLARMAALLADAIGERKKLLIIADYDADGATACAVGLRALHTFGGQVDYLVPDRFRYGYGLTPEIVRHAVHAKRPDILITVDNGIASVEGVAEANRLGLKVLITDHHLPGAQLPDAWCIVNPNQPGCEFPSKHLAGVGVMFYLMLALRAEFRERGAFSGSEPNLAELLPLVALGTVADVVKLDANNRILVQQGLRRIRAGRMQPGVAALFRAGGRDPQGASVYDLAFVLGPRLNAAGRLSDMSLGIECLSTGDAGRAAEIAAQLDALNRERRMLEADMHQAALAALDGMAFGDTCALSLFDPAWHPGVVGIVASRLKERFHRPTIAFARGSDGEIRGSGRSIPGFHLRDGLDLVAKRHPGLILRFGGHAAAAGVTLREADFSRFAAAFREVAQAQLTPEDLRHRLETDGSLAIAQATLANALLLREEAWGQGFPEPRFFDRFEVIERRVIGERHLKLRLGRGRRLFDAVLFGSTPALPAVVDAVYRFEVNEYNGARGVQLTLEHWQSG